MLLTEPNKFTVTNRTIKNNHLFLVDDPQGEIMPGNDSGLGLYLLDTRFLSGFQIRLNQTRPVCLLSSTESGYESTLVYTNGQISTVNLEGNPCIVLEETIQLKRETLLNGALFERFTLVSFNVEPVRIDVTLTFEADFQDIFEIRHLLPPLPRHLSSPVMGDNTLMFAYEGNGKRMETLIQLRGGNPERVDAHTIRFPFMIHPLEQQTFEVEIHPKISPMVDCYQPAEHYTDALSRLNQFNRQWQEHVTRFSSDNDDFNEMLNRSHKDLRMLLTQSEEGSSFLAAGIPWYVCLFGRDSIFTARECLMFNPDLARWTLEILAAYQGKANNPERDEEPGKILHELRRGELAQQGLIPHTPYYGSVDATPLWLILLYDYFAWTNDYETTCKLWPHALQALEWIERKEAETPLGYVMYQTQCPGSVGIIHQGWKDSNNSAMYENGLQAEPPIALVEVQGYVYLAKKYMASLAERLGHKDLRNRLRHDCKMLKQRFNRDFWMNDHRFYALGLDNQGKPLRVISSNPGHCLETGICTTPNARHVANRLMRPDMFSGWGIRTLSADMKAYNPMSYHNGSVWPHDNAIIAKGLSDIGRSDLSEQIFSALFQAAQHMDYKRLPELFCGFPRDASKSDPPVRYPVACSPQAWAAGSVYFLIQSMLGLRPDLPNSALKIHQPKLPRWMSVLRVQNMRVGQAVLDLEFTRTDKTVMVDVHSRSGKLDILVTL